MDAIGKTTEPKYECLLFDIDDTLYPLSLGLNLACRRNIIEFMTRDLKIEESEVSKMCLDLYKEHGTTMAGLKVLGYEFDDDEFHAYVHGRLPYEKLKPDPVLRNLLLSIQQRKILFTNADKVHAAVVLKKLGLEDCFEGVICFETLNQKKPVAGSNQEESASVLTEKTGIDIGSPGSRVLCKPSLEAFETAILIADIDPKKTIFFDDSVRNIETAKLAGLTTVFVGSSVLVPGADYALSSIHNIKEAIPEIWEPEEKEQLDQVLHATRVETMVRS